MSKSKKLLELIEQKTRMLCNECGHKFSKKLGPKTYEVKCPRCGSYDTEPD